MTQPTLPRLKFCGLTRAVDVECAIECGADAIGLNFYGPSRRYIAPESAAPLSRLADRSVMRVGVFVNPSIDQVVAVVDRCPLDCIQLHGRESAQWLDGWNAHPLSKSLGLLRATPWRGGEDDSQFVHSWMNHPLAHLVLGWMVDAYDPIQHGGTGQTARWDLLSPRPQAFAGKGLLLAGGLRPDNLEQAIRTACPDGVDLASGIEFEPGVKDPKAMRAVAEIVRHMIPD